MCTIDNVIILSIPEGFRELSQSEVLKINPKAKKNNWGAINKECHLIYNIAWKKISLFNPDLPLYRVIDNTEQKIRKQVPAYKKICDCERTIGTEDAVGFRYSYNVQNIDMISEYIIIKHNKKYYAFICAARAESFKDYYHLFEEMIDNAQIK